jgi:hypothetical protein
MLTQNLGRDDAVYLAMFLEMLFQQQISFISLTCRVSAALSPDCGILETVKMNILAQPHFAYRLVRYIADLLGTVE